MKKLLAAICLVLALLGAFALAEDTDTVPALWPACDPVTGLWGYVDAQGAWAIAPQWEKAYHFHGGCAIVDTADASAWDAMNTQGIIDETGTYLLEPAYCVDDACCLDGAGLLYLVSRLDETWASGWFSIPNRYFSGLHWTECYAAADTPYIQINLDYSVSGLADRATGEVVVPMIYSYTALSDDGSGSGFIVAERADTGGCELIEIGAGPVALPEGVYLDYVVGVVDSGLVTFCTEDDLQGYLNTSGEIVLDVQYWAAGEFRDGYARVTLLDGTHAVIDCMGRVVLTGMTNYLGVIDGALLVEWEDDTWGLVEPDGAVRCRHRLPEGALFARLMDLSADAPLWVQYALNDDAYTWGLMSREGELLDGPCWENFSGTGGGLAAVCQDGRWGYVDPWGNQVLPFLYAYAGPFEGALARVTFDDGGEGYINRQGEAVCSW